MSLGVRLLVCALALAVGFAEGARGQQQDSLTVLGEVVPGTGGSFVAKARLTQRVIGELPVEDLAALFGFDAARVHCAQGSGGYRESIAPNVVVTLGASPAERGRVSAFALAWSYVYQQETVPVFTVAPAGRPAVLLEFALDLAPAREGAMFAALIAALGRDAGYTRLGRSEILVIDFHGGSGFQEGMAAFAAAMAAVNPVVRSEAFAVRVDYHEHDWRAEPAGESLLAAIRGAYADPAIEQRLRRMRERHARLVLDWMAGGASGFHVALTPF